MVKSETIVIRVSPESKAYIARAAEQSGVSMADYARMVLENQKVNSNGKLAQLLACHLCELAEITNCVEDPSLRKRLVNLEEKVWRFIE